MENNFLDDIISLKYNSGHRDAGIISFAKFSRKGKVVGLIDKDGSFLYFEKESWEAAAGTKIINVDNLIGSILLEKSVDSINEIFFTARKNLLPINGDSWNENPDHNI
jgi:hypothetical protein